MAVLQNKIDFALVIAVNHANPNGDPLLLFAKNEKILHLK